MGTTCYIVLNLSLNLNLLQIEKHYSKSDGGRILGYGNEDWEQQEQQQLFSNSCYNSGEDLDD